MAGKLVLTAVPISRSDYTVEPVTMKRAECAARESKTRAPAGCRLPRHLQVNKDGGSGKNDLTCSARIDPIRQVKHVLGDLAVGIKSFRRSGLRCELRAVKTGCWGSTGGYGANCVTIELLF